jgi:glutaredoxin
MTIELYKSALCPRCAYAAKILKKLKHEDSNLEIITYDIATNMKAFKEAGISIIPTIKIQNEKKSWILPKTKEIKSFIQEHQ